MLQHCVDTAADEAGIDTDSTTMVSVIAETSSKDSTNGVSPAGELPTQIREALEKVLEKASKHSTHWTWVYLHRVATKKVRLHKSTRDWVTGAVVGEADFKTHLYCKALKTNPNIVQREASTRILRMCADGPALHCRERVLERVPK